VKVLVADDDPVSRALLAATLAKWGHEPVLAADGAEAWERYLAGDFRLVISDWMMPELDGPGLVRRIRAAARPGYTFVVLLTARADRSSLVEGLEAGADDFAVKPIDPDELRARLRVAERIIGLETRLAERNRQLEVANDELEAAHRRVNADLDAAARVQRSLLPTAAPATPGARFAWHFEPCEKLAGDLLDVFRLDDDHVAFYVLDVSGHGAAAALLSVMVGRKLSRMADAGSELRRRVATAEHPAPPVNVARELARLFPHDPATGQYFTILIAALDLRTRELRVVSAGHPPPVLVRRGEPPRALPVAGPPIGLFDGLLPVDFVEHRATLARGDRLTVYSDGLSDALAGQSDRAPEDDVLAALAEAAEAPIEGAARQLAERARSLVGELRDDVSVVCLEID
jgi:sigma-B regulation protein RsbU (phosphoserine phosphatase)